MVPSHGETEPIIAPVVPSKGVNVTDMLAAGPVPHELEGVTVRLPLDDPKVTERVFEPCPAVIVAPEGTTQE